MTNQSEPAGYLLMRCGVNKCPNAIGLPIGSVVLRDKGTVMAFLQSQGWSATNAGIRLPLRGVLSGWAPLCATHTREARAMRQLAPLSA